MTDSDQSSGNQSRRDACGPKGWHSRGYLPHFDGGAIPQSITFRLADSVPEHVVEAWRQRLQYKPKEQSKRELGRLLNEYADEGHGVCHLRLPQIGRLVEDALLHFETAKYVLHAWVVMPNHVHVLITPNRGISISEIVHSWKSFTAKKANRLLGRTGSFWAKDYFDRFMRDNEHFARTIGYIEENPVKASLCAANEDWPFSSDAWSRFCGTEASQATSNRT